MTKTARILFVGNSFTRIGDLPGMLTAMLNRRAGHERYEAETSLADGRGFHWHWFQGEARQKIEAAGFDFVVLQGSSLAVYPNPINAQEGYTPEAMATYSGKLIELARQHGSQPILFAPQAASGGPEDQRAVIEKYVEVARTLDVRVYVPLK